MAKNPLTSSSNPFDLTIKPLTIKTSSFFDDEPQQKKKKKRTQRTRIGQPKKKTGFRPDNFDRYGNSQNLLKGSGVSKQPVVLKTKKEKVKGNKVKGNKVKVKPFKELLEGGTEKTPYKEYITPAATFTSPKEKLPPALEKKKRIMMSKLNRRDIINKYNNMLANDPSLADEAWFNYAYAFQVSGSASYGKNAYPTIYDGSQQARSLILKYGLKEYADRLRYEAKIHNLQLANEAKERKALQLFEQRANAIAVFEEEQRVQQQLNRISNGSLSINPITDNSLTQYVQEIEYNAVENNGIFAPYLFDVSAKSNFEYIGKQLPAVYYGDDKNIKEYLNNVVSNNNANPINTSANYINNNAPRTGNIGRYRSEQELYAIRRYYAIKNAKEKGLAGVDPYTNKVVTWQDTLNDDLFPTWNKHAYELNKIWKQIQKEQLPQEALTQYFKDNISFVFGNDELFEVVKRRQDYLPFILKAFIDYYKEISELDTVKNSMVSLITRKEVDIEDKLNAKRKILAPLIDMPSSKVKDILNFDNDIVPILVEEADINLQNAIDETEEDYQVSGYNDTFIINEEFENVINTLTEEKFDIDVGYEVYKRGGNKYLSKQLNIINNLDSKKAKEDIKAFMLELLEGENDDWNFLRDIEDINKKEKEYKNDNTLDKATKKALLAALKQEKTLKTKVNKDRLKSLKQSKDKIRN